MAFLAIAELANRPVGFVPLNSRFPIGQQTADQSKKFGWQAE